MKVTLISDTHTKHRNCELDLPGGDLLIHAGDFMNSGYEVREAEEFFKWFDQIKTYDTKVLIAGNHDRLMENDPEKMLGLLTGYKTIEYLQDELLGDPRLAAQECDCDFSTSGDVVFYPEFLEFYSWSSCIAWSDLSTSRIGGSFNTSSGNLLG